MALGLPRSDRETAAWMRAAQRALSADLVHQLRVRGSAVLVPSKTTDGVTYHVQLLAGGRVGQCDCPAGLNGRACAHVAAVAIRLYERATGARVTVVKEAGARQLAHLLSH